MEVLLELKKVLQQKITVTLDKCSSRYVNVLQYSNTSVYIKEHIFHVSIDQSIVTWPIGTHKKYVTKRAS